MVTVSIKGLRASVKQSLHKSIVLAQKSAANAAKHSLHDLSLLPAFLATRDAHGYPETWWLILFMYFLCSFSKFLHYFTKVLYSDTSISKIIAADLNVLLLGYTSATLRYTPLPATL